MKFEIRHRFTGAVQFECEIDAPDETPHSVRLGLAIKAARVVKANLRGSDLLGSDLSGSDLSCSDLSGSNLSCSDLSGSDLSGSDLSCSDLSGSDLRGSDLRGSDLRGSDLSYSDLSGSDLRGSDLRGSNLRGDKLQRLVAVAQRLDGYSFFGFQLEVGSLKISAGCRWFTLAEYRSHIAREYPGTRKASETTAILDFIEARAKQEGVAIEANPQGIAAE